MNKNKIKTSPSGFPALTLVSLSPSLALTVFPPLPRPSQSLFVSVSNFLCDSAFLFLSVCLSNCGSSPPLQVVCLQLWVGVEEGGNEDKEPLFA